MWWQCTADEDDFGKGKSFGTSSVTLEDHQPNKNHVSGLQNWLSANRSTTGLSSLSFDFPHCHWLDCENNWKPADRTPVDLVDPAQGPRLHRWPRTGLLFLFKYQMICATIFIEVQNWTLEWPGWTKVKLGWLGCINDCLSTTYELIKLTSVRQIHILYNFMF